MPEKVIPAPNVPPFVTFVASAVPMVFDNSMSYYEALCALWKWLQDDVINVINNNASVTNDYIDLTNEYTEKFIELKNYVDTYFDNLDVQEEINNKLDAMVEDGTLQEIITTYLQSNVTWTFDTVAEMQAATNLTADSYAQTLGFYSLGDGGGAVYKIEDTGTANGMDVIVVNSSLYASLVHNGTISIKQLGAIDDNSTNNTAIFDRAFTIADNVIVNKTSSAYKVQYIKVPANKKLEGECLPYVKINIEKNGSTVVSDMGNNSAIDKIYLNSLDDDLSNNRFDIRSSNVKISNCRFDGFRHSGNNAWGILLTGAKFVDIDNCYFNNNTQSDIAIVEGCENISVNGCSGTSFHINIEPNSSPYIDGVKINQCELAQLDLRENQNTFTTCHNILVSNCIIDLLVYDGASVVFDSCTIKDYQPESGNGAGGIIEFINTGNFSENLLDDVYLNTFDASTSATGKPWYMYYTSLNNASSVEFNKIGEENVLVLNPSNSSNGVTIQHTPVSVTVGKRYMIRIRAGANYVSGSNNISKVCRFEWLSADDTVLATAESSMFRGADNSVVPIHSESIILTPPENATKLRVRLRNSPYGKQSFSIASVEMFEIKSNEHQTTQLPILPINKKRIYTNTAATTNMNYSVGDIMYYTTPTSYIGKVCTASTTTTYHTATWNDFGAISS